MMFNYLDIDQFNSFNNFFTIKFNKTNKKLQYIVIYGHFVEDNIFIYIKLRQNKLVFDQITKYYKCEMNELTKSKYLNYYKFDNLQDALDCSQILNDQLNIDQLD